MVQSGYATIALDTHSTSVSHHYSACCPPDDRTAADDLFHFEAPLTFWGAWEDGDRM